MYAALLSYLSILSGQFLPIDIETLDSTRNKRIK